MDCGFRLKPEATGLSRTLHGRNLLRREDVDVGDRGRVVSGVLALVAVLDRQHRHYGHLLAVSGHRHERVALPLDDAPDAARRADGLWRLGAGQRISSVLAHTVPYLVEVDLR